MASNYDLAEFAKKQLKLISEISKWRPILSSREALEIVQSARRYRKNSKDEHYYCVHCLNEDTGNLEYINITYERTLKEFIVIFLCDPHCLSKQQIKTFLTEYKL